MKKGIVALAVVGVLAAVVYFATLTRTEVELVNASPIVLADVSFVVEDGEERTEFVIEAMRPGWKRTAGCGRKKMPLITVGWREEGNAYRFEERADLWTGETWRIEIQKGGRVVSGYLQDGGLTAPSITVLQPVAPR